MRGWIRSKAARYVCHLRPRQLSTVAPSPSNVERVSVKCGSAGSVCVDLHNIGKLSSSDPLLIYLPPFSTSSAQTAPAIPGFLRRYPIAAINYRWAGFDASEETESAPGPTGESPDEVGGLPPLSWPVPVHDTLSAYSWVIDNLTPSTYTRREAYVYGSYLGASLATSLALTESYPHQRMAVRGCIAYNGIYNWTTFLPDHQINKQSGARSANILEEILGQPTDPAFQDLKQRVSTLFRQPSDLFDPFASACLFFQTSGLLVPPDFDSPADPVIAMLRAAAVPTDGAQEAIQALMQVMSNKPPRRSPLAFPPRKSTLKLPNTLLLHSPAPSAGWQGKTQRRKKVVGNHFKTQAEDLASLMRRSLAKLELRDRAKWDEDFDEFDEIDKRVQVYNVGADDRTLALPSQGEVLVNTWLADRLGKNS
ncbi:hypothetical protein JX266_006483 [Neoarthrinium moseri]|nr:hypothetical protein JX266_006483 [Neoarthrinium moseri]